VVELGGHGELVDAVDTFVRRGPQGGNLNNPRQNPQHRRQPHSGVKLSDGTISLHKFNDVASAGHANELPWHRMAAHMMVARIPNRTIANSAGVSEVTVSQLKAQRWFQELLATIATDQGQDILNVVKGEALASVSKLIALRDYAESERVQLAAATTLLEHAEGKPVQRNLNVTASTTFSNPQEEYSALQQELETLRKRNS
jgi:hypothetical protein